MPVKLSSLRLKTGNPGPALEFYTKILGMTLKGQRENERSAAYELQYPGQESALELIHDRTTSAVESYQQEKSDNYWKFSLFVDDIQQAYRFLMGRGVPTNEPHQFGDIGYLMHTQDHENYQLEFIQKTFQHNSPGGPGAGESPDRIGRPLLGLITIRTRDPMKSIHFYESCLGMKMLVRMYVNRGDGFTLYFLGTKDLRPPNPDWDAIENREWLYQQQETFIELQYYWGSEYREGFALKANHSSSMGLDGIKFRSGDLEATKRGLSENDIDFTTAADDATRRPGIRLLSPDAHRIVVEQRTT